MGIISLTPWKPVDFKDSKVVFESFSDKKCASVNGSTAEKGNGLFSSEMGVLTSQPVFNKSGLLVRSTPQTKLVAHKATAKKRHASLLIPEALFLSAAETVTDSFWKTILKNAASGKWPRGFKFRNNTLLFQHKNKILDCPVPLSATPEEVATLLVSFIQKHSGLQSETDRQRDRETLYVSRNTAPPASKKPTSPWALLRARSYYLNAFVQHQAAQYRLSATERMHLVHFINYGLLMKWIGKKNIVFDASEKAIETIEGIAFDTTTRTWHFTLDRNDPPIPPKARKEKAALSAAVEAQLQAGPKETRITALMPLAESLNGAKLVDLIKSIKTHSKYTVYEDMAPAPGSDPAPTTTTTS